jgi:hypothetical protein
MPEKKDKIEQLLNEQNIAKFMTIVTALDKAIKLVTSGSDDFSLRICNSDGSKVAFARNIGELDNVNSSADTEVNGQVLIGDGDNGEYVNKAISGDGALTKAGVLSITDLTLTSEAQGTVAYFNGSNWVVLPVGSSGQFLQTQGAAANVQWASVTAGDVDQVHADVRKSTAGTITGGNPVYIVGYNLGGWFTVEAADASAAATMPAIGILEEDCTNSATVQCAISGLITSLNTNAFNSGDEVYVANGGGLTATKPTGTNLIQKVAVIGKKGVATGTLLVIGAGRVNDVPNIANTKIWIGDASGVPQEYALSGDATMSNAGVVTVASAIKKRYINLFIPGSQVTGDGQRYILMNFAGDLTDASAYAVTGPTGAALQIQIHNLTQTADMLSTVLEIDAGDNYDDGNRVIDTDNDDFADQDILRIDIDQIGSTIAGSDLCITLEVTPS